MKWQILLCVLFLATTESRWLLDSICDYELTDPYGLITSPNYPHSYPSSIVCTYKIKRPLGNVIALSISHVDLGWNETDNCSGRLEVYDGEDETSPKMDTFCGTDYFIPGRVLTSSANHLFLKLESHSQNGHVGFQALYKMVDRKCGGLFKTDNGTIRHPAGGGNYNNNEDCTWVIQAPPTHTVKLIFTAFATEARHDYVQIKEMYKSQVVDIMRYTQGNASLSSPISSRGSIMYVNFKSDGSSVYSGFTAKYNFVDASTIHPIISNY